MRIYGIPLTGSVFVEAESPAEAFETAKNWSEVVLRDAVTSDTVPIPASMSVVILNPQNHNIKDATDLVMEMAKEAGIEHEGWK